MFVLFVNNLPDSVTECQTLMMQSVSSWQRSDNNQRNLSGDLLQYHNWALKNIFFIDERKSVSFGTQAGL